MYSINNNILLIEYILKLIIKKIFRCINFIKKKKKKKNNLYIKNKKNVPIKKK